jgi:osmotically-inducible protein OsmY
MASVTPPSTPSFDDQAAEALQRRVQAALASSPLMALRHLVVVPNDGRIFISGHVASFYQKQQAQELVRAEAPGVLVVNEVEVG